MIAKCFNKKELD